jgi:proline iminopeptidase
MFEDPRFRLTYARLVTHYASHYCFVEDGAVLRGAAGFGDLPGAICHGRFDFAAPFGNAWALHRAWPNASLTVIDDAGHHSTDAMRSALVEATDRFAGAWSGA